MKKKYCGLKLNRIKRGHYNKLRIFGRQQHEDDIIDQRKDSNYQWPNRYRYHTYWRNWEKQ